MQYTYTTASIFWFSGRFKSLLVNISGVFVLSVKYFSIQSIVRATL